MGLLGIAASGCSSYPPPEIPPDVRAMDAELPVATDKHLGSVSEDPYGVRGSEDFIFLPHPARQSVGSAREQEYQALSVLPAAHSRALRLYLGSQTFDYFEDGELFLSGPIASGKTDSPTPTGSFSVLSKDKDKESSKYTNEVGTPAWMPYSLQFYGDYFVHEGWLPGYPASHGCIRVDHYDARLLFERMRLGDPVTVAR